MQDNEFLELQKVLIPQLVEFGLENFGYEALDSAWAMFHADPNDTTFQPKNDINVLFIPWFLFNWPAVASSKNDAASLTIAEAFVEKQEATLSNSAMQFIQAATKRPYSFGEVIATLSKTDFRVFDLLQQKELILSDKRIVRLLEGGEIIFYSSLSPMVGKVYPLAVGPTLIPNLIKNEIIEIKDELMEKHTSSQLDENILNIEMSWLIGRYLDFQEEILTDDDGE